MADTKTSELTEITSADNTDLLEIVDVSDTTFGASGTNKKITKNSFLGTVLTGTTASFTTAKDTKLNLTVASNVTGVTGADAVTNIISLTQAEYDAIVSKSVTTFYIIVG